MILIFNAFLFTLLVLNFYFHFYRSKEVFKFRIYLIYKFNKYMEYLITINEINEEELISRQELFEEKNKTNKFLYSFKKLNVDNYYNEFEKETLGLIDNNIVMIIKGKEK